MTTHSLRRSALLLAATISTMDMQAQASAEEPPLAAAVASAIESCVDTATIRFADGEPHAVLDETDAGVVGAAILARYPLVAQDGFEPSGLVLWRKPETGWVYIALLANPEKPAQVCFTATFAAEKFGMTPPLLKKYFGISDTPT